MSDDLVKRAREWDFCWPSRAVEMLVPAMADRIEELEGQLKAICERNNVVEYANAELGEKLYGAVEDFETIADTDPDAGTEWFHEFARIAIAKIKGEQP